MSHLDSRSTGRRVVEGLLLLIAVVSIGAIVSLNFAIFGTTRESVALFVPGLLAGLVAALMIFLASRTFLKPTKSFLSTDSISLLANSLAMELQEALASPGSPNAGIYGWYSVPWSELFGECKRVDFLASYMDTWINQIGHDLRDLFARGGCVAAYLPVCGTEAAHRVGERFPEYTQELIDTKIKNTRSKLRLILKSAGNKAARCEIYSTKTFCMWCLVRIDAKWLILSPFDHYRRGDIEGPAFVISLEKYPQWGKWADKELAGFRHDSEMEHIGNGD